MTKKMVVMGKEKTVGKKALLEWENLKNPCMSLLLVSLSRQGQRRCHWTVLQGVKKVHTGLRQPLSLARFPPSIIPYSLFFLRPSLCKNALSF